MTALNGSIENYRQAVEFLLALVDHERQTPSLPRQKRIYDLRRISGFLDMLGRPQDSALTVHIAGTKGKGSTAAMVDSVLSAAGYSTGFYSSPHLHTFRERIRRDGKPISEEEFTSLVYDLGVVARRLERETDLGLVTLFEFMTGMAFQCFAQDSVDFQVIEVGLGGKLDATNVVKPTVCAITSISLDHMAILGDTIAEIAADKAGIIKEGAPVVLAPQASEAEEVVRSVSRERGSPLIQVGEDVSWRHCGTTLEGQSLVVKGRIGEYGLTLPLLGAHQRENAATAVAIAECLAEQGHKIGTEAICRGIGQVSWPCRLEVLGRNPAMVTDGAHNVYSMETMLASLRQCFKYERLIIVAGFSRDKIVSGMVEAMVPHADMVVATRSRHPRSMAPGALAQLLRDSGIVRVDQVDTVSGALARARENARPEDLILGTGSLFVAAEVREAVLGIEPELYPDLLPRDLR